MEKEIQKRGIINTLRNMDVGDVEEFPIIQKTSVTFTLNQRLYKERSEGSPGLPSHMFRRESSKSPELHRPWKLLEVKWQKFCSITF